MKRTEKDLIKLLMSNEVLKRVGRRASDAKGSILKENKGIQITRNRAGEKT